MIKSCNDRNAREGTEHTMTTYSHTATLATIRRTTTPEYLGTEATEADVASYLDLLASRWPVENENEPIDGDALEVLQTAAFNDWCKGVRASDEIEIISVNPDSSEDGEGAAYWVTAQVNGKRVRLFAAPHSDGRPGLEPCGDSLDDWCPVELRTAFGDDEANRLGREAILMARP